MPDTCKASNEHQVDAKAWLCPPPSLVEQWLDQWDLDPDAHCNQVLYVAWKAAEWGYTECNAEYAFAAMDIYPPTNSENFDD